MKIRNISNANTTFNEVRENMTYSDNSKVANHKTRCSEFNAVEYRSLQESRMNKDGKD